jgi:hypothetical protein
MLMSGFQKVTIVHKGAYLQFYSRYRKIEQEGVRGQLREGDGL